MASHGADQPASENVTDLLLLMGRGDAAAFGNLVPLVHAELRRLARSQMRRERSGHTLQTTALVNEAYLRLVDINRVTWQDRTHFFAMAARLMRRVLVDHARARGRAKRGGNAVSISLETAGEVPFERATSLVALDDALKALAAVDPRKAQVVELRFFGGFGIEETAGMLSISQETVMRDWRLAKVWLLRELRGQVSA